MALMKLIATLAYGFGCALMGMWTVLRTTDIQYNEAGLFTAVGCCFSLDLVVFIFEKTRKGYVDG